jgi:hypothetical protein
MEQKQNIITNDELLPSAHHHAKPMLSAGVLRVLVACEESQTVCKAFRDLGHQAYSCDYQKCSGQNPEWHIQGNAIVEAYSGNYDLMIAHPPCTYISRAGARWLFGGGKLNAERYEQGLYGKAFFEAMLKAPIKYIAVENPTPMKIFELPKESQVVQPYQFGHEFSKRTLLWLKGLPELVPTDVKENYVPYLPSNTGGAKRGQKATPKSINQKERSKTFEGIARAMAVQWSSYACR